MGAAMAPVLSGTAAEGRRRVENFRIRALLPSWTARSTELDGRLDSDTHVALDPRTRRATSRHVSLAKGAVEASAGGGEFHDISADVSLAPMAPSPSRTLRARG